MSDLLVDTQTTQQGENQTGTSVVALAPGSDAALAPKSDAGLAPNEKTLQAEASSAHSRINVPLNLDNWKDLSEEIQGELTWFHQHLLEKKMNWDQAQATIQYDRSTIFRVLKGTYAGNYDNVVGRIRSYRELMARRGTIQQQEFVPNEISKLVWAGLDYALSNSSITMIIGESRLGKTISAKEWCNKQTGGNAVFITIPPIGGPKAVVKAVAHQLGIGKNQPTADLVTSIYRGFNHNRILVADEAHRCLPSDLRTFNPAILEFLRDIKDQTGCALAIISTQRLPNGLKKGAYQYEQLIGRIGMPILLPTKVKRKEFLDIVKQFIPKPSATLMDEMDKIANSPGRLGILVETLKVASRMANKSNQALEEIWVFKAIALRRQMSGEEGK